jgi:hypothetical protein
MSLRRAGILALTLSLAACTEVKQEPRPDTLVLAAFASPNIPQPSDLALNAMPTLTAPQYAAQRSFLLALNTAGGFPNDQEVAITIPVEAKKLDAATNTFVADTAPTIDPASVTDTTDATTTVAVYRIDVSPPARVAVDFDVSTAGVLKLRKKADASGSRRWIAGARYVAAVRGGASGVKATSGIALGASLPVALIAPNMNLALSENQPPGGLTPALVTQLEQLRAFYWTAVPWCNMPALPPAATALGLVAGWNPVAVPSLAAACSPAPVVPTTSAFGAVSAAFAPAEVASITTFTVAPEAGTYVTVDSGSGVVPLPIDLARNPVPGFADLTDPSKDTGLILNNPAFGAFSVGLATLDGFSTTAMILAQTGGTAVAGGNVLDTRGAILASTVTPSTAQLYKRSADGATWSQVMAIVTQPPAIQGFCSGTSGPKCSQAIGLAPAAGALLPAATPPNPGNAVSYPPLDENSLYAVVITTGVHDAANQPLVRSTVAKVLLGISPAVPIGMMAGGTPTSLLGGIDGTTAVGLQKMRAELTDLFTKNSIDKATVAMAYTFKTQSIKHVSALLAAIPYSLDKAAYAASGNTQVAITPLAVTPIPFAAVPAGIPTSGVNALLDVQFMSVDAIDKSNGALNAAALADPQALAGLLAPLHALVVVPDPANTNIAACPAGYPSGFKCPHLVIFGHGLNGSKETLLTNAATLAGYGFIAAAIDFPLHGSRNWCKADADCMNANASAGAAGSCDKAGAFASSSTQGDTVRPGVCASGTTPRIFDATSGAQIPSRFWLTSNFFRTRDTFRQNVLDVSALTLALNRPPAAAGYAPQPASNPFAARLGQLGLAVNPATTYYEGISLGSIAGVSAVAANPRISRALFSVGGGSLMTLLTNSRDIGAAAEPVLGGILPGFTWAAVTPGSPSYSAPLAAAFLKVVSVAGWILDSGDPLNFAQTYTAGAGMPDFLADPTFATRQADKEAQGQVAYADTTVPNISNWLLYENMGLTGSRTTFYYGPASATIPYGAAHSILGTTASVQADAAGFLLTGTPPATPVALP